MWRFFPWALIAALGVVVAVNIGMAVVGAAARFPGTAVDDAFDHSNDYDKVLATAEREAALGWTVQTALRCRRVRW